MIPAWAALVNPHHAEEVYWSFEMTVAWNTVCSDWSSNPWDLSTRSVYNDWADELMTDETCSCIEKLLHSVTPMIFREFTRWIPGMMETLVVPRELGFLNIISWDFDLFSDNLFSLAHCFKFTISCMGVGCRYDPARVIHEFKHIVSDGYRAKIGRHYDVCKRSQTGALDDARHNSFESWLDIVEFCTVCMVGQEIDHPVVNIGGRSSSLSFSAILECLTVSNALLKSSAITMTYSFVSSKF